MKYVLVATRKVQHDNEKTTSASIHDAFVRTTEVDQKKHILCGILLDMFTNKRNNGFVS